MSDSHAHTQAAPPRRRGLFRRDEDGLTTLEWLLIVAAVAGLAALAVVLVQNVVDDTAEQIGGSSARQTAARVAASQIKDRALVADASSVTSSTASTRQTQLEAVAAPFKADCDRLNITYSDAGITATWTPIATVGTGTTWAQYLTTNPTCVITT